MKRFPLFLLFTLLTLSTVPAQANIINNTIGNIQQAINNAYNPNRGQNYKDSRNHGWQRKVSNNRRKQYNNRRRQFKDRRRQLNDRQRQLNQKRRQLKNKKQKIKNKYGQ